jgi:hypothetical protein
VEDIFIEPTVSQSHKKGGKQYDEDINSYEDDDDINVNFPRLLYLNPLKLPSINNIENVNDAIIETINENNNINDNIDSRYTI